MTGKPIKVFTLIDHYLPGFRQGGPTQTISNLVARMPGRLQFYIFTRNHDHGAREPYRDVRWNEWTGVGKASVFYASPRSVSAASIIKQIHAIGPDVIYANSLFSRLTIRLLVLRRLRLLPQLPVIVAPRGELAKGALALKARKKSIFLRLAARTGLLDGLTWQASTELERADIERALPVGAAVRVSRNIAVAVDALPSGGQSGGPKVLEKPAGHARFVYLARIAKVKNLAFAIRALAPFGEAASLDIYGPIDEAMYWRECQGLALNEASMRVVYKGALEHGAVHAVLREYDFLLLPTLGENFGHSIFEAFMAGCPPMISDRTPWRGLGSQGIGWDLPLESVDAWRVAIQEAIAMGNAEHRAMAERAMRFAEDVCESDTAVEQSIALFESAFIGAGAVDGRLGK